MGDKDMDRDPEKGLENVSTSLSEDHSERASVPTITKEPDITSTIAPAANTEDVLKIVSHDDDQASVSSSSHHGSTVHRPNTMSRTTSVYNDPVKVPRSQRRGLLARFAVIAEVVVPTDYDGRTKWMITFVVAMAGAGAPMGSSIILPALKDVTKEFDTQATIANLAVALYMLSMSIFPLWWSSFSETLGRRTIYISSFALFLVFNILSAVSTNIAMFIVMRLLSGGAAASVQAVGAGTIADIWEVKERGRAMGYFYLGPLCGPLLAPIIGGALAQRFGWRADMWFMAIYGALLQVMIVFCLPETLKNRKRLAEEAEVAAVAEVVGDGDEKGAEAGVRPSIHRTTTKQSVQIKAKKYGAILRRCFLDPLKIILHLRRPAVALTVGYASITFCSLYFLNISIQQTFSIKPYNYSVLIIGLLYLPNSVGYFLASVFGGKWVDNIMHREARKAGRYDSRGKLIFLPEDRMRENVYMAAVMYPLALIWYGWTAEKGVNIAGPMIANFFFGVGSMLTFGAVTTMLTEFMPSQASHGVAVNNFVRNIFSCIASIVAEPLIVAIGNGWVFTILGIVCLVAGLGTVWSMKEYSGKWRENAKKAALEKA